MLLGVCVAYGYLVACLSYARVNYAMNSVSLGRHVAQQTQHVFVFTVSRDHLSPSPSLPSSPRPNRRKLAGQRSRRRTAGTAAAAAAARVASPGTTGGIGAGGWEWTTRCPAHPRAAVSVRPILHGRPTPACPPASPWLLEAAAALFSTSSGRGCCSNSNSSLSTSSRGQCADRGLTATQSSTNCRGRLDCNERRPPIPIPIPIPPGVHGIGSAIP